MADAPDLFRLPREVPWIALLERGATDDHAIQQIVRDSCFDYHTLPVDLPRLLFALGHAFGMASLGRDRTARPAPLITPQSGEPQMVAVCAPMHEVFGQIRKIASVDAPVMITGETGTGKELAARAIHERSQREGGPLVTVNCAALPATLIQSELFGYEKGAFTGANKRSIGRVEAANGGTLFLDEIGDLPHELQTNLLRFLQEGTIHRLGSNHEIPLDVRVIAATNLDVEKAVADGRFREDLYFRLNVLQLAIPPLRERGEDTEVLAKFFFEKFVAEDGNPKVMGFSQAALRAMAAYTWPGNVRELINRVRRAVVMCEQRLIQPADLGLSEGSERRRFLTLDEARATAEKDAIGRALRAANNNITEAARSLGVSRPALYRAISKHGLSQ